MIHLAESKKALEIMPIVIPNLDQWKTVHSRIKGIELKNQHATSGMKIEVARFHLRKLNSITPTKKATDLTKLLYDSETNKMEIYDFPLAPVLSSPSCTYNVAFLGWPLSNFIKISTVFCDDIHQCLEFI